MLGVFSVTSPVISGHMFSDILFFLLTALLSCRSSHEPCGIRVPQREEGHVPSWRHCIQYNVDFHNWHAFWHINIYCFVACWYFQVSLCVSYQLKVEIHVLPICCSAELGVVTCFGTIR
jgi:hypothetical protein